MEYYSVIKRNELSCTLRHGGNLNALLGEICQPEKATCCKIPTIKHSGKGKTMETFQRSVVDKGSGVGGREGWVGGEQGIFRRVKLFWYCNGGYLLHHYTFLKPMECTTQRVSPDTNYELQLIMYSYWLIDCTRYTKLIQDVNNRETLNEGLYRNSLYFLLNFSVNLKPPLKKQKQA